ncbi:glutathione S-transferase family protein [Sandarakinorhabdus sp.]|uniref:glutathione S-transferase family protein n=1 Tax=Sandarakinorhabdus sp. TaxID=1916663 RepID=UPI00286E5059|nr:glutathione S-transferase family protein [Sandarakinorhabdus sp.]
MKLYGGKLSPFVMRPLLVSRAKGSPVEPEAFEGGIKCDAYVAMTPMAKMPLLVDGDFCLPESQPIADYLDAVLPGPSLMPADAKAAATVRLIIRLADVYVVPNLGGLFGARDKPEGVPAAMAGMTAALGYIEHFRNADDDFVVGGSFTQADAALIPLFFFLDALDGMLGTAALVAAQPGLAAWWARAKATALGAQAVAEQAEGLKAMMGGR